MRVLCYYCFNDIVIYRTHIYNEPEDVKVAQLIDNASCGWDDSLVAAMSKL